MCCYGVLLRTIGFCVCRYGVDIWVWVCVCALRNASFCGWVCLQERVKERERESEGGQAGGRASERGRMGVEVSERVQRSVVALAVSAWMRLVLQFLQRTWPSRG